MPKQRPVTGQASGSIIICGRWYNIGWKVVNFWDNPLFSAYTQRCYKGKDGNPPGLLPFAPAKGLGLMIGAGTAGRAVMSVTASRLYTSGGMTGPMLVGAGAAVLTVAAFRFGHRRTLHA